MHFADKRLTAELQRMVKESERSPAPSVPVKLGADSLRVEPEVERFLERRRQYGLKVKDVRVGRY
jgi:hypothetical protein